MTLVTVWRIGEVLKTTTTTNDEKVKLQKTKRLFYQITTQVTNANFATHLHLLSILLKKYVVHLTTTSLPKVFDRKNWKTFLGTIERTNEIDLLFPEKNGEGLIINWGNEPRSRSCKDHFENKIMLAGFEHLDWLKSFEQPIRALKTSVA